MHVESFKQNYYIISLRAIIKAFFTEPTTPPSRKHETRNLQCHGSLMIWMQIRILQCESRRRHHSRGLMWVTSLQQEITARGRAAQGTLVLISHSSLVLISHSSIPSSQLTRYMRRDKPETQEYMWHFNASWLDKEFSSRRWLKSPATRELDREKDFHKVRLILQRAQTKRSDSWQDLVRGYCWFDARREIFIASWPPRINPNRQPWSSTTSLTPYGCYLWLYDSRRFQKLNLRVAFNRRLWISWLIFFWKY